MAKPAQVPAVPRLYLAFRGRDAEDAAAILATWHRLLKEDKRGRAALRRAQSVDGAFAEPLFHRLRIRLTEHHRLDAEKDYEANTRLARATLALAEIDEAVDRPLGAVLAKPTKGKGLTLGRFRLLTNMPDPDLFLRLLRGALVMTGRHAPPAEVAQLVLDWHHDEWRAKAKRRLALVFFEHASKKQLEETSR